MAVVGPVNEFLTAMHRLAALSSLLLLLAACGGEQADARRRLGIANCDSALTSCRVSEAGITVTLTMGPPVRPLQPFPLSLRIDGGRVEEQSVVVDFQMQGMDMGPNRYRLLPQDKAWQGTATLPVCSASRMDWLAVIEFTLDGEPLQAVFPFHTEAN